MIQDKQSQQDQPGDSREGDRKIAQPKGRAGRFSNAHMAEFKKMDSIAGHASAFRATPGRFKPVDTTSKTLKRTKSKARLDEPESQNNSPSKAATPAKPSLAPALASAKRVKHDKTDDASTRRPTSKEGSDAVPAPAPPATTPRRTIDPTRRRTTVRSSLMTPTRVSMARASSASAKPPRKPSMIPAPTQSPAGKPTLAAPRTPQTEFKHKVT